MLRVRRFLAAALVLASTEVALAEPSEKEQAKGRELATVALDHYQKEQYADALTKFQEAEKLYPTAQVLRMQGYTLIALKRFAEAADLLERSLKTDFKPLLPADAEDTEDQLKEALKKVGSITIRSSNDKATLRIDNGEPRPLPQTVRLSVGSHRFVVEAPNYESKEEKRDVVAGTAVLQLNPGPKKVAPPPETTDVKPSTEDSGEPASKPPEESTPENAGEAKPEPPKGSTPSKGWFPQQRNVGIALASVGVVAGGTALGLGIHGLQLQNAVQTNIDLHNRNYDPACSRFSAYCRADIALINHDGERAAALRNTALVTGLVGAGLATVGGLFLAFAPDGPFAAKKADEGPKTSGLELGCGITGLGAACSGSF
ncbi:MAG: hypothetical protein FJ096_18305 [Deltaproteobacteria bacterium]|nr:hypothetical protein [Deltaproteobacteria bacterium]